MERIRRLETIKRLVEEEILQHKIDDALNRVIEQTDLDES